MGNKIASYSFLATINNGNNKIDNLLSCFEPLVKSAIASLYKEKQFEYMVTDLQNTIHNIFGIEMPIPVIVSLVKQLAITKDITISEDYAIIVKDYTMEDYLENYEDAQSDVQYLEEHFKDYLIDNNIEEELKLYDFINLYFENVISFSKKEKLLEENEHKYYHHAKFIEKIAQDKEKFNILKKIFWGALISSFLTQSVETKKLASDNVFLIDTSFLVSLLGYHSEISNKICKQVYQISINNGYRFEIFSC